MPVLYSTVARGATVLAKYAACSGNFQEITEHILAKIPADQNDKMTYTQTGYLFHYIVESGITYLCITNEEFERPKSFAFLVEIKRRFVKTYNNRVDTALPYAMQSEFSRVLATEMTHFSSPVSNNLKKVEEDVDQLKDIMIHNIDSITQRGERLELLVDKTDNLRAQSMTFKKSSVNLSRAMYIKNVKIIIAILTIILCFAVIIGLFVNGL